jgi:hypothetical protein
MWETILASLPIAAIAAIIAGAIRAVAGWIENAAKDGKIESWEWKQLGGTMIKYFSGILLLSTGLDAGPAVATMFGLDVGTSAIKSLGNKK